MPRLGSAGWRWACRRWGRTIIILALLAGLSYLDRHGYLLATPHDGNRYDLQQVIVLRVIDGDTIEVDLPDPTRATETTRVRLWGIDCPETARAGPVPTPAQPWADQATELTRRLVMGRKVTLRIEPHRTRGVFGRLLAHVDLDDGTAVADELLKAGLARADPRWMHSMIDRHEQLEWAARRRRIGIWKTQ